MARNPFVKPDTVRLELRDGDFLIVRKQLNAGEYHDMFARVMKPLQPDDRPRDAATQIQMDPMRASRAEVLAYLVDWSFVDDTGAPITLRGQSPDFIEAALRNIDLDTYNEIVAAVQAHERQNQTARLERTGNPTGALASLAI